MAITHAVQKGNIVYVYNGAQKLFERPGILQGYSTTTVTIKVSSGGIYTYNEKGNTVK